MHDVDDVYAPVELVPLYYITSISWVSVHPCQPRNAPQTIRQFAQSWQDVSTSGICSVACQFFCFVFNPSLILLSLKKPTTTKKQNNMHTHTGTHKLKKAAATVLVIMAFLCLFSACLGAVPGLWHFVFLANWMGPVAFINMIPYISHHHG